MLYEIIQVKSSEALTTYDSLLKKHRETRQYPFIIGDDNDLSQFEAMIEPSGGWWNRDYYGRNGNRCTRMA